MHPSLFSSLLGTITPSVVAAKREQMLELLPTQCTKPHTTGFGILSLLLLHSHKEQRHQHQLRPPFPTSTKKWSIVSCTYEHMNSAVTKRVKRNKLVGYLLSLFHTCTLILNCIQHWVRFRIQHRTTGKMCRTENGHVEDWWVSRKIQISRVKYKEC